MKIILLAWLMCIAAHGCTQRKTNASKPVHQHVGGPCEGCEAIYESSIPFSKLHWTDTLPDFSEAGPKLVVSGTVYQPDGKTPAPDVVLYVYHTNQQGYYVPKESGTGWGRHGYIRGWVKTNRQGRYRFYTLKPAPYPGRSDPAHIHPVVKEPGKNEYYIDEFRFDDDPLLTVSERGKAENRGGSGIMRLQSKCGMLAATRDIILGKNIPDYPTAIFNTGPELSLELLIALR